MTKNSDKDKNLKEEKKKSKNEKEKINKTLEIEDDNLTENKKSKNEKNNKPVSDDSDDEKEKTKLKIDKTKSVFLRNVKSKEEEGEKKIGFDKTNDHMKTNNSQQSDSEKTENEKRKTNSINPKQPTNEDLSNREKEKDEYYNKIDQMQMIITKTIANEANVGLQLQEDKIILYTYDDESTFYNLDKDTRTNPFVFIDDIPSLFSQEVIKNTSLVGIDSYSNPIFPVTTEIPEVVAESKKIFDTTTSIVTTHLNSKNLLSYKFTESSYSESLMAVSDVFFVNTTSQQVTDLVIWSNRLRDLILIEKSTKLIIKNIPYTKIVSDFSSNYFGKVMNGLEILSKGSPHLFYGAHVYTNEFTNNRLRNVFFKDDRLLFKTGRFNKLKVAGILTEYKAYATLDQYTSALLDVEYKRMEDNKITIDSYIKEARCFATKNTTIFPANQKPFYDQLTKKYRFSNNDKRLVLLANYFFPVIANKLRTMATEFISSFGILSTINPSEYFARNMASSTTDSSAYVSLMRELRLPNAASLYDLIIFELTAGDFVVDIELNPFNDTSMLTFLLNYFFGMIIFPRLTFRLTYKFAPCIYKIMFQLYPDESLKFQSAYGLYSKKSKNGTWVKCDVSEYDNNQFMDGIMPSYLVVTIKKTFPTFTKLQEVVIPKYYPVKLKRRQEAGYPFINDDYISNLSWPVVDYMNKDTSKILEMQARLGIAANLAQSIAFISLEKTPLTTHNGNNKSSVFRNTIVTFINIIKGFIPSTAEVICNTIAPLAYRVMQTPLLTGSIYDLPGLEIDKYHNYTIAIGASKEKNSTEELINMTYTPFGSIVTLSSSQFLNIALTLEGIFSRHNALNPTSSNRDLQKNIVQIDPLSYKDRYDALIRYVKDMFEIMGLYTSIVKGPPDTYEDIFAILREKLYVNVRVNTAAQLLSFITSWTNKLPETVLKVFGTPFGTVWNVESRVNNFTLVISSTASVKVNYDNERTMIGRLMNMIDEYTYYKYEIILNKLLLNDKIPTYNIAKGLILGYHSTQNPKYYTPGFTVGTINIYNPEKTFRVIPVILNDQHMSGATLNYFYQAIDDDGVLKEYEVNNYMDIQHKHTLKISNPSDITQPDRIRFLIDAILYDKIKILITDILYRWNAELPLSLPINVKYNQNMVETILTMNANSNELLELKFLDDRNVSNIDFKLITKLVMNYVMPLDKLPNFVVATGLHNQMRTTEPYINANTYRTVNFDSESLDDMIERKLESGIVNFSNVINVLNKDVEVERPPIEIINATELF